MAEFLSHNMIKLRKTSLLMISTLFAFTSDCSVFNRSSGHYIPKLSKDKPHLRRRGNLFYVTNLLLTLPYSVLLENTVPKYNIIKIHSIIEKQLSLYFIPLYPIIIPIYISLITLSYKNTEKKMQRLSKIPRSSVSLQLEL